jgi:hypothetical protein
MKIEHWWDSSSEVGLYVLPRSLSPQPDAPNFGAQEKIGPLRSG